MKPTPITNHDHVDGPAGAKVTLIEYGDFECPYCVRAFPAIEEARAHYRDRLRFVYRHVPKLRADGFSKQAAEASEFAAATGRFWDMHRMLFTHPEQHDLEHLVGHAKAIGLDEMACRSALTGHLFAPRVKELAVAAIRSGIIGTPTLFINGERYMNRCEPEPLIAALDRAYAA